MKNFARIILGSVAVCAVLVLSGCQQDSTPAEDLSSLSNPIQLGVKQDSFLVLSEFFARQLVAFGLEFGEFATTPKFLGRVATPTDSAHLEISRLGLPFLTISEARLSEDFTFADVLAALQKLDLQPAVFGENSFYFTEQNRATNLIALQNSALAFQLSPQDFELARGFISSLLILR